LFFVFWGFTCPRAVLFVQSSRPQQGQKADAYWSWTSNFWSIVVAALAYYSWRAGYQDAWMAWGLLLPVNLVGFIYFLAVLFIYRVKNKK